MKGNVCESKTDGRNPNVGIRPWSSWLIFLLLCGYLIFCHGCHGDDVDDELCAPPPSVARKVAK